MTNNLQQLTVGGGCFWCVEAIFQQIKGVEKVVSGYSNGDAPGKPTYREVCSGLSGFVEVVQVDFNSEVISYEELLIIFMTSHDPTSLNRQGADAGTQYRSGIYYQSDEQKEIAETVVKEMIPYFDNQIVTEIKQLENFYTAEDYHQDYYNQNSNQAYCNFVIAPKLAKLKREYASKLK